MSDRPNAAAVLATSTIYETDGATEWTDGGQFLIEALRAAVGATEGQPVVLLGDGTLSVPEHAAAWDPPDEVDCDCPETATWCPECGGTGRLYYDGPAVLFEDEPHPDGCVSLWRIPGAES